MDLWHSLAGMVRVRLLSADMPRALGRIEKAGISVFDALFLEELSVEFSIRRRDWKKLRKLAVRIGCDVELVGNKGLYWRFFALWNRPVLMIGLTVLAILTLLLPTRVLFIRVEGNGTVPARKILEAAENCGLGFFSSRRQVRSERIKNGLLETVPELSWAGINTKGCVATISVRERTEEERREEEFGVTSLVACRDGIISSCTVTAGSALCKPGQAVRAGEVLISGFTDCGLSIRAERARGEVYAETARELDAMMLLSCQDLTDQEGGEVKYALIIGKKRINLYFGSGISDITCGRMYTEYTLTLPGGFGLPVVLVREQYVERTLEDGRWTEEDAGRILSDYASSALSRQMIAGTVLSKEEALEISDGLYCLKGRYGCLEMIAREQNEEIIKPYGTDH